MCHGLVIMGWSIMGWLLWIGCHGLICHGLVVMSWLSWVDLSWVDCHGLVVIGWLWRVDLWLCPSGSGECPSVDSGRTGEQGAERGRKWDVCPSAPLTLTGSPRLCPLGARLPFTLTGRGLVVVSRQTGHLSFPQLHTFCELFWILFYYWGKKGRQKFEIQKQN